MLEFYKNKKVLVTGHTGFKGCWLCKILLMSGADVLGYALEPNTSPNLFNLLDLDKEMTSVIADIRNLQNLKKAINDFQPEIVFHLAAQPIVRESYKNPIETYEINVMGTVNLLEVLRECKSVKSIINITTDKVYLNNEWSWGYREIDELCGYDPYSNSKSCSELVTYSYKNSFYNSEDSPAISTARSGNVIGGGDFAVDRIIPDCVRAAQKLENIIVRNPYSTRPYQHVLECLNGYLLLAEKQYYNKELSGNYNFGPNDESCISTGDLVSIFCDMWGNIKWENKFDNGPHEANFLKLDCSKSKNKLNWNPKLNINDAIELVIEYSKCNNEKKSSKNIIEKQIINYYKE